jgi:uncharacterized protein involved in outer membrane biogenesis
MHRRRTVTQVAAWLAAVIVALLAGVVIFVLTFDWNRARPWVDDTISQAIGRQFTINGDLKVGWGRPAGEHGWRTWIPWPRFTAQKVTIANPEWARTPHFATLDEIGFEVEALPLLARRIAIPSINLVNPSVDLERLEDNRNNWTFKLRRAAQPSEWKLDLENIALEKGRIAYFDEVKRADLQTVVDTLGQPIPFEAVLKQQDSASRQASAKFVGRANTRQLDKQAAEVAASEAAAASTTSSASAAATTVTNPHTAPTRPAYAIGWTLTGTYNKTKVHGTGKIGAVLALQDSQRPFPVQADLRIGDTHVAVVGTLTDPAHLAALDLRLWLSGVSMSHLYDLSGVTLPDTPPYATEGRLIGQLRESGSVYKYEDFTGRVGGSDLNGSLTYLARRPRPLLQGEVVSNLLQFSDLGPIIGADSSASKAKRGTADKQPVNKALPTEEFRTDRWKAIDADVKFTGRRIVRDVELPLTDLYSHVILKDGLLALDPLKFGVAGGTLASEIRLDGSGTPLKGRFSLSARHLKLKQLFPKFPVVQNTLGEVNGDAALSATGNSPAALAGTLNGEVKALVNDGAVSRLLMEAAGLNVANVVYEKLFNNRDVKINCAAADFVATNGVLDSRVFALDTGDAVIVMNGTINLRTEMMDLVVHPHTKGLRIFSLRSPLYVRGTFKQPRVGVEAGPLLLRSGAAIGLGLLNPFAALIPLVQPSNNKPLPCQQMLTDMEKRPTAPPPGRQQKIKGAPAYLQGTAAAGDKAASPASGAAGSNRPGRAGESETTKSRGKNAPAQEPGGPERPYQGS